jgi:hypothetical protein
MSYTIEFRNTMHLLELALPRILIGRAVDWQVGKGRGSIPTLVKKFFSLPAVDKLKVTSAKMTINMLLYNWLYTFTFALL